MSLSYSKISLDSIAQKLQLDSAVDAEFIVAKAIRDGVIEAHIDHENGFVQTKDLTDVYSTLEPMRTFNQRIKFCLELRNQSVKAMRFPPKKYSEELTLAASQMESINGLYKIQLETSAKNAQINEAVVENNLKLKDQMESLTSNLSSLNNVYGGMLSAMSNK